MEELFAVLEAAFENYRADIDRFEQKRRPADGLFGLGCSLQNDPCHDRLDQSVEQTIAAMCALHPSPSDAERILRLLLRTDHEQWPLAAQWMLYALERHSLPVIPFLDVDRAAVLLKEYARRYRPWNRLPAQKKIIQTLKQFTQAKC